MKWMTNWLNRQRPHRSFPLSDFERISLEVRPCDVILVEGRSRVSDVIRWLTNSPWTHAALYIGAIEDISDAETRRLIEARYEGAASDQLMIESLLGQGVVVRNLDIYDKEHLRICRPVRLSGTDAQHAIAYAASRIGYGYDVRQIIDLARFLLPWYFLPKRWASSLFVSNPGRAEKTVCSTMIAEAFGSVHFPILPLVKHTEEGQVQLFRRNPRLCTPSDFDYSPYFEIIKYAFVDFYHEEYHLLPWRGTGTLTEEEAEQYLSEDDDPRE